MKSGSPIFALLMVASLSWACSSDNGIAQAQPPFSTHPRVFSMVECWL